MEVERKLFVCECGDVAHQLVISYFPELDEKSGIKECYATVHLNKLGFFERLKNGLKYIFKGHTSRFGDYAEFLFFQKDADKLQDVVNYLKSSVNE